jgi:hypothetical protein
LATADLTIQTQQEPIDLMRSTAENREDAKAFIEASLAAEDMLARVAGADRERVVADLLDRSESNFMYLMYVLGDVRRGLLSVDDVRTVPQGLRGYYVWHWARMVDQGAYTSTGLNAVAILAKLDRPVTSALLAQLARTPEPAVVWMLGSWAQFVEKTQLGKRYVYRIYHNHFRDFLRSRTEIAAMGVTPISGIELADRLRDGLDLSDDD